MFYNSWAQAFFTISSFRKINLKFWDVTIVAACTHPYLHAMFYWFIWHEWFQRPSPLIRNHSTINYSLTMRIIHCKESLLWDLRHASLFQSCHNCENLAVVISCYWWNEVVCVYEEIYRGLFNGSMVHCCIICKFSAYKFFPVTRLSFFRFNI